MSTATEPPPDVVRLTNATRAVTETMLRRDYELDCVLGSRLLRDRLRQDGVDAEAVGTNLLVIDPTATKKALKSGAVLWVGGMPYEPEGGFNGHVVVRAVSGGRTFLLDPTFGQLINHRLTQPLVREHFVLAIRLAVDWPTPDRETVQIPFEGWTIEYTHMPHLNWTEADGWNHPDLATLDSEVHAALVRGPDLEDLIRKRVLRRTPREIGRNVACPCGSGRKFKHCCGR